MIYGMIMLMICFSCTQKRSGDAMKSTADSTITKDTPKKDNSNNNEQLHVEDENSYNKRGEVRYGDYTFKYGYVNRCSKEVRETCMGEMSFLEIYFKDDKIYTDSITFQHGVEYNLGDLGVDTFGVHDISGRKLFFSYFMDEGWRSSWGCSDIRYFYIDDNNVIKLIKRFKGWSGECGDKSCSIYFPQDSLGEKNKIILIEKLELHDLCSKLPGIYTDKVKISFDKYGKEKIQRTNKIKKTEELDWKLARESKN